jgi:CBS domain-containing protein
MSTGIEPFAPGMDIRTAKARLTEMQRNAWPVADQSRLLGVLTARRLDQITDQDQIILNVLSEGPYPYVYSDHALSLALERMGSAGADALPVVSRADRRELKGIVTLSGVLAAFGVNDNKEVRTP